MHIEAKSHSHSRETDAAILQQLRQVDWNFEVRQNQQEVESVHPYPAKFIADLPGAFIDVLPMPEGSILMDPFCGSGTTLAEGQRRGIKTLGVDLNPIACLISRVKTSPLSTSAMESARQVTEKIGSTNSLVPSIPNLNHWFKEPIQRALAPLMNAIDSAPPEDRDFLRLAASSIIVRVSNQDSDTRYAAVEKKVKASDVPKLFLRSCERLQMALQAREYPLEDCTVIEGDLLSIDLSAVGKKVGLFVTSPPYPNAYEYWLYHKYRMWWLGHDPLAVKAREIGARAHFFKKNHHTAETFVDQMSGAFSKLSEIAVEGAWACFVVGRSKIHGKIVDNAAIIERVGAEHGFELFYRTDRDVLSTRKSFNLSHAMIKSEAVIVLRNKR